MAVQQRMTVMESLLNLFRIDTQVRGLRTRLDTATRYLKAQERQCAELRERMEELQTRRRQTQAKAGNLEGEIAVVDERLEKLRGELNNAANNKQYTAVLTELNTVKTGRSQFEEQALQQMQQIEQIDGELAKLQLQLAERTKVRDVAQAQLNERQSEVGQRLAELEGERAVAAEQVPSTELAAFNKLADAYEGEAMSKIEEIDRRSREYACGACNMHMPFETVSLLVSGSNALARCTACGRILYLQDETKGAVGKK